MKPPVETIRISKRGKEILIRLKRSTGLKQWNELCRWALASSLSRKTLPPRFKRVEESNIEMNWRTFAGTHADVYSALISSAAIQDGIDFSDSEAMALYFRSHLERGLSGMQNIRNLSELLTTREY